MILLLIVLLFQPPAPHLTAAWAEPAGAVISWQQPPVDGWTCLHRKPLGQHKTILINCWMLPEGYQTIRLGGRGPIDAAYHPAEGDEYILRNGETILDRAGLPWRQWLPVVRPEPPILSHHRWLPVIVQPFLGT